MDSLKQKHWYSILNGCQLDSDELEDNLSAVNWCAITSIELAKGFLEWADTKAVRNGQHEWTIDAGIHQTRHTTDELITMYILKELSPKK